MTDVEIFPAFGYGSDEHVTTLVRKRHTCVDQVSKIATFHSRDTKLQLDVAVEMGENETSCPIIEFQKIQHPEMLGEGLVARIRIEEGQTISFVLRKDIPDHVTEHITTLVLDAQQHATQSFWYNFISQSKYKGRWREVVSRSLMILKMMTYGKWLNHPVPLYLIQCRAHGSHHCRAHFLSSRRHRRCQKLGLSILLGSRLELYHLHLAPPWFQSRSRCVHGIYHGALRPFSWT